MGNLKKKIGILKEIKKIIPDLVHLRESDPLPPSLHEVTFFNPINNANDYVAKISEVQEDQNLNLDLSITPLKTFLLSIKNFSQT